MVKPNTAHTDTPSPVFSAWRDLLAETQARPWLANLLSRRGAATFHRFTYFYHRLLGLPERLRRRWQRKLGMSLAGAALLLALSGSAIHADPGGVIVVDEVTCTLVDAITAANTDTATGGCPAGSGADAIELQANVVLTEVNNETYGATGLPVVTSEITIEGGGHSIRRNAGAPDFRILAINSASSLTLNYATVSGGRPKNSSVAVSVYGGGILNTGGTVVILNSSISGNSISSDGSQGGGLSNLDGTVRISDSTLVDNTANSGGGINNNRGVVTILNSTLSNNSALGGGGIFNGGRATVQESVVKGNTAYHGGGIQNAGALMLESSTISDNAAGSGGGVRSTDTLLIKNATFSDNSAMNSGGAVDLVSSASTLEDSVITGNTATIGGGINANYATLSVSNSIISNNSATLGGGVHAYVTDTKIQNSTLSGNMADRGGGIYIYRSGVEVAQSILSGNRAGSGGGISVQRYGLVTVVNSTLSGNSANYGGGVTGEGDIGIIISASTLSSNTADKMGGGIRSGQFSRLTLNTSIVTGNSAGVSGHEIRNDGSVTTNGNNLIGHNAETSAQAISGFTAGPTDIVATSDGTHPTALTDILDTNLAENGGPTRTHALASGSPAIDTAPSAGCTATPVNGVDQRGFPRNVDGDGVASDKECDIGAYEAQFTPLPSEIPEPATLLLLGSGLAGLAAHLRRRAA